MDSTIKLKQYEPYVVRWRDHFTTDSWQELDGKDVIGKEVLVTSIGFFIGEDTHYYHFAQSIADDMCSNVVSVIKDDIINLENVIEEASDGGYV